MEETSQFVPNNYGIQNIYYGTVINVYYNEYRMCDSAYNTCRESTTVEDDEIFEEDAPQDGELIEKLKPIFYNNEEDVRLLPKEKRTDRRFCQFESFFYGYRAALILLSRTYKRRGWTTIEKIIQRFAPAPENNVEAYIEYVWKRTGITPKEQIQKPRSYYDIVKAMAQYECGSLPDPDDLTDAYNSLF